MFLEQSWAEGDHRDKEQFEDTKGAIRIRISKKNKQHNGQKKKVQKDKQRSTKHTYKTKDRVTRTPLKTGGELRCSGRVSSSCSTSGTRRINLVTNLVISREWGKKIYYSEEKFEDVKCVIRRSKNDMQYNDLKKKLSTKGQTTIYKTLHRKLKIEQR